MKQERKNRILVGVSGASGFVYAARTLEVLKSVGVETHLIVSKSAEQMRAYESNMSRKDLDALAHVVHQTSDVGAPPSSGSFDTLGMIIVPCSMRSLAEIATGVTSSLLTRAADVTLKERRRLVLMVRESPLNLIHLRNMTTVTEAGGIIFPPVPAFFADPKSLDDIIDYSVGRALELFGLNIESFPRWTDEFRKKRLGDKKLPDLS